MDAGNILSAWPYIVPFITAGLGFLAGILAEPLKLKLLQTHNRRELREAIHRELNHNYDTVQRLFEQLDTVESTGISYMPPHMQERLVTSCFEHARTQPILFQSLNLYAKQAYEMINTFKAETGVNEIECNLTRTRAQLNRVSKAIESYKKNRRLV